MPVESPPAELSTEALLPHAPTSGSDVAANATVAMRFSLHGLLRSGVGGCPRLGDSGGQKLIDAFAGTPPSHKVGRGDVSGVGSQ